MDLSWSAPATTALPAALPVDSVSVADLLDLQSIVAVQPSPMPVVELDPTDPEKKKKKVRLRLRRVLLEGLPLVGVQALVARKEKDEKDEVDPWHSTMDAPPPEPDSILGWPQHNRWAAYEASLTGPTGALLKHHNLKKEQTMSASCYCRVSESALVLLGPTYQWQHGVIPA